MPNIPPEILESKIEGLNLDSDTLKGLTRDKRVLLVFLRHLGCIFCPEIVRDLRQIALNNSNYPEIVFFYQGTLDQGKAFFKKIWPEAKAISDSSKKFYNAFKLKRGTISQLFGQKVWVRGTEAMIKGNFVGLPVGDLWTMPGMFLIENGSIVWQHEFEHIGDHPDLSGL
ncbi:MAG: SelL-related redox protein [Candidatus Caenarcaniphilales bacterium]|nr:SelL-related redox protein [Candidatus Caenarcaniphilales bacterium]